ncbi:MAG: hypothetical protein NVSMB12_03680 [Acidimicrobiales bacterium]
MPPSPGTIAVWVGPARGDPACCSAAEHHRAARHRNQEAAATWLAARALLRVRLGDATGRRASDIALQEDGGGKPFDPDTDLQFNLSHSGDVVAIAIAGQGVGPVGVDIEAHRRVLRPERLAARLFSDGAERDRWAATAEPQRTRMLLQRWTRVEALLKATGTGMRSGIRGTEARLAAQGWTVRNLDLPGPAVGAVAARGDGWTVRLIADP